MIGDFTLLGPRLIQVQRTGYVMHTNILDLALLYFQVSALCYIVAGILYYPVNKLSVTDQE